VRADLVLDERGRAGIDELKVAQVLEDFTPAGLAAALAVVAVTEYARLVRLRRVDVGLLLALGALYPVAAWRRPSLLSLAPIVVLACALPAVLSGGLEHGVRRTTFTAFGSVWTAGRWPTWSCCGQTPSWWPSPPLPPMSRPGVRERVASLPSGAWAVVARHDFDRSARPDRLATASCSRWRISLAEWKQRVRFSCNLSDPRASIARLAGGRPLVVRTDFCWRSCGVAPRR